MNSPSRLFAWCFVATVGLVLGTYVLMAAAGRGHEGKEDFHFEAFGRVPVREGGRVKPIDTLARVSLMVISGKQEYTDDKGVTQPATRWLLDVLTARMRPGGSGEGPVPGGSRLAKAYRIDDPALRRMLKVEGGSAKLFSLEELSLAVGGSPLDALEDEVQRVRARHSDARDAEQLLASLSPSELVLVDLYGQLSNHIRRGAIETSHRVFRIDNQDVLALLGLTERPGFRYGYDEIMPRVGPLEREAARASGLKPNARTLFDQKALDLAEHVRLYDGLARGTAPTLRLIAPSARDGEFRDFARASQEMEGLDPKDLAARAEHATTVGFFAMLYHYARDDKPAPFNKSVSDYLTLVEKTVPGGTARASTEASMNSFAPFYVCTVLYVVLLVVLAVSWIWPEPVINRFAFYAMVVTVCIHTTALGLRMYIQGRPPVTNLYSSAVFIGWICVLVTLVVEWIYRNGVPLAVGAVTGALTLLIAHHLGGGKDTMEMLVAVLDTNFWLATHVTSVTIGYSATFVAGFFGKVTVLWVLRVTALKAMGHRAELSHAKMKFLGQCIYGVVCFAMLFSFLGTVLGGIWADYSWGRFWGWDAKENGALLIVIMNALILHARWGGLVKVRGMAVLALVGNMVTMWSWFGTNQLGVGLHNYGFNKTLALMCSYFWLSQLLLIGLALIPFKAWNPPYLPVTKAPEPEPEPTPTPRKARPGRGRILPGGAT